MDLIQFFGRFHVLVLHLPIGILLMAAVMEMACIIFKKPRSITLKTIWLWGFISACGAALLGYMLSLSGGYDEHAIFVHRTWAIGVIVCSLFCWIFFAKQPYFKVNPTSIKPQLPTVKSAQSRFPVLVMCLCTVQLFLLFSTGHYGANMTHGSTYLFEYAPNPIRALADMPPHPQKRPAITQVEQADVYLDVIQPILAQRCLGCHNAEKSKGKLDLSHIDSIFKGGKSGPAVVAGDLTSSELYKRITLDSHDKKYMPAGGKTPLNDNQVATIKWWITANAPAQGLLANFNLSLEDKNTLAINLGLAPSKGAWPLAPIKPISAKLANELTTQGFVVKQIAKDIHYLDIDYSVSRQALSETAIQTLIKAKDYIVWLNLANSQVTDEQVSQLAQLPNVIKLHLEKNPISDQAAEFLSQFKQLTYLNLYQTQISDNTLTQLSGLDKLTNLYLGGTQVSQKAIQQFYQQSQTKNQEIKIVADQMLTNSHSNKPIANSASTKIAG